MYPSKIRLSTSNLPVLLRCDREFQIEELLQGTSLDRSDPILTFGHAWGEGIMEYLVTKDLDAAVYHAWRNFWPPMENIDNARVEEFVFHGLRYAKPKLDNILRDWHVATFNGEPAREIGFHLDINDRFYFESMMDGVLEHNEKPLLAVIENKHTMYYLEDITPLYKNTMQALMYSIVLDKINTQTPLMNFDLNYFVGQFIMRELPHVRIHHFPWKKTLLDRLNMFLALGMDVARLQQMIDINLFPMRGQSCLRYNRPCPHFGFCQSRTQDVPKTDAYVLKNKSAHQLEVESRIRFTFALDEIVKDHLKLISEMQ